MAAVAGVGLSAFGAAAGAAVTGAPDAGAPAACEAKITTFASWIADAPREPSFVWMSKDVSLVQHPPPGLDDDQLQVPTVEVRAHGPTFKFSFSGSLDGFKNVESLRHQLAEFQEERQTRRLPARLIIAADRDARWSAVIGAVAAAADAGYDPIEFAFAWTPPMAPPATLSVEAQRILQIEDPFDRMRNAALLFDAVARPCPPATQVFNKLGGVDPHEKIGILVAELPGALARCACATDPEAMKQPVWLFLLPSPDGIIRNSFVGARIKVAAPGAPATVVRAKKDAHWSTVAHRLLDAAKPGSEPRACGWKSRGARRGRPSGRRRSRSARGLVQRARSRQPD